MNPSYIGYTDEQPKRIQKAYIGVNDDPHVLLRVYVGDQSGYVKPAYVATTSSSTTYLTSAIDSSGLSSTTALTCVSTSGESYLTSEETTGTRYLTGTVTSVKIKNTFSYKEKMYSTRSRSTTLYAVWLRTSCESIEAYVTGQCDVTGYLTQFGGVRTTCSTWFPVVLGTYAFTGTDAHGLGRVSIEDMFLSNCGDITVVSSWAGLSSRGHTGATGTTTRTSSSNSYTTDTTRIYSVIDCSSPSAFDYDGSISFNDYWELITKVTSTNSSNIYLTTYDKTYVSSGYDNKIYTTVKMYNTVSSGSNSNYSWTSTSHIKYVTLYPHLNGFNGNFDISQANVTSHSLYLVSYHSKSTTGTSYLTSSAITGTSYLTRESTSAYSGVSVSTTTQPIPVPEPSTDGNHILFLGKNNGRSGLFSNDCGLTWETVTSIFPEFDDGSTYAVQKTAFKLVWHSGYFYFLRVVSKQKYSYSSNYYHWLDIHRIKDDLTGTSEQVLAPYELEYIGNTPTSASVILSTAEAISGTIYLSAKVNSSTVLELDFDALSVVAAVYQTGSIETIRYLPDIGLIGMRNYKSGSSSGNTYNWVFKDILSSSPISIFPIQYSGSAQMYFTLLDSAHSPGLVHSRDTLLQANWTNAAGGSSKIGYFVDESGTTSFNEISGLGSIIFQDMGTGSNSWIDENFFAYQFGDYLVYSIYKDKAVYVVSNFGSNSPTRTVLFGGTNSGPSLGCVCKDRIILTRNRNIYTVDLANVSSTQVASNVISFSDDSCCFCVNTQHGNCLK